MQKINLFLVACVLLLTSCAGNINTDNNSISIRIKNNSTYNFEQVTVDTGGGSHNYQDINSQKNSRYHNFKFAYSYASITLLINNQEHSIQAIDYVGEERLKPGKYTYVLTVNNNSIYSTLTTDLIKN